MYTFSLVCSVLQFSFWGEEVLGYRQGVCLHLLRFWSHIMKAQTRQKLHKHEDLGSSTLNARIIQGNLCSFSFKLRITPEWPNILRWQQQQLALWLTPSFPPFATGGMDEIAPVSPLERLFAVSWAYEMGGLANTWLWYLSGLVRLISWRVVRDLFT